MGHDEPRKQLIPPPDLSRFIGGGDFEAIGQELLEHLTKMAGLKTSDSVLDVGCGIGRAAIPLTRYLEDRGKYEGFDVIEVGIDWCRENISRTYPNFHFQWADVLNKAFNSTGHTLACEYVFPFPNESFDIVFLTSVFTHMLPPDLDHYLSEISRVLRKRGRCLATFFLASEESFNFYRHTKNPLDFKYDMGEFVTTNKDAPESAIAYKETDICASYAKNCLKIMEPIHYRACFPVNRQDIIVAQKQ